MVRRNKLKIIFDILRLIEEHHNSIKPTPLLRFSNLSSQSFSGYYDELIQKGFIKEIKDKGKNYVTLTDKGFKYIQRYKKIINFIDDFNL